MMASPFSEDLAVTTTENLKTHQVIAQEWFSGHVMVLSLTLQPKARPAHETQ